MSIHFNTIKPYREKAIFLAQRQLSELVCDAVNLEGINYTLPEVQTLLDGVSVGGHKLSDQNITLNQAAAWQALFKMLKRNEFECNKTIACKLHAIAAENEALRFGEFRTGAVTIAGSDHMPPKAETLDRLWQDLITTSRTIDDIYDRAIYVFLQMARQQFFYDVNKRMGRFMMNGIILDAGYPAINVPAARQQEFNRLMLAFYSSNDTSNMNQFMLSCLTEQTIDIMSE